MTAVSGVAARHAEITAHLDQEVSLARIEAEVIEPAWELEEDERAGLWLFAWSYDAVGRARRAVDKVVLTQ